MTTRNSLAGAFAWLLLFGMVPGAMAAPVAIANPGFEEPLLDPGDFDAVAGWNAYSPAEASVANGWQFGAWNPPSDAYPGGAPAGRNVGWVYNDRNGPIGLQQALSVVVVPNTRYTLGVLVGDPLPHEGAEEMSGFPGYRIELVTYAGGEEIILAADDNTLSIQEGTFERSTITYDSPASGNVIGKPLIIRLIGFPGNGYEVDFDDVTLDASLVEGAEPPDTSLQVRAVAITGQLGPSSGAVDGRFDGRFDHAIGAFDLRFLPFVAPIITDAGFVAFEGAVRYSQELVGKPNRRGGIWVWDPRTDGLRFVMISGMAAPGGGNFTGSFSELRVGQNGTVLFDALLGEGAPSATALFRADPFSPLSTIVRQTMPAPGGGTFGDIRLGASFINQGHIAINEMLDFGGGRGVWQVANGTPHAVAVPGMAVPGMPEASFTFASAEGLGSDGHTIVFAIVDDAGTERQSLWHGNADGLEKVAMVGDPAPGGTEFVPLTYTQVSDASINNSGHVAFRGAASSFLNPFQPAIWGGTLDNLRLVARRDDPASSPHFSGDTFDVFRGVRVNGEGQIAFSASTGSREGIWIAHPTADGFHLQHVVKGGEPVMMPGFDPGVTFHQFPGGFSFNSAGQLAFLATLSGTGITIANNLSIWVYDPLKGLRLIARKGSPSPVGGEELMVSDIQFTAGGAGQDGKATGLSDTGILAYMLGFADDSYGLFAIGAPPLELQDFLVSELNLGTNGFRFQLIGPPGRSVTIEGSIDLTDWVPLHEEVLGDAPVQFIDPGAVESARKFYRVQPR